MSEADTAQETDRSERSETTERASIYSSRRSYRSLTPEPGGLDSYVGPAAEHAAHFPATCAAADKKMQKAREKCKWGKTGGTDPKAIVQGGLLTCNT